MLHIEDLSFSFATHAVLQQFNLTLAPGEIGTLIGSSGSGKTTLFRLLTGILTPQQGKLSIAGCVVPDAWQHVAYMTQDDLMLPWRTVLNNLLLVGELGKRASATAALRAEAQLYLREMGLADWQDAYPHELSGGMRQRVSLARVLLQKRPLLLLDEPFASLDVSLREQMHALLHDIRRRYGTTMLMVTHDFRDALSLSDRILLLNSCQISREWKITDATRQSPLLWQEIDKEMRHAIRKEEKIS